jgi:hypothetical protein
VTLKRLVVPIAGADRVTVRKGIPIATREGVSIDLYLPAAATPAKTGAVVLATGVPDEGARRILGCAVNEMASFSSWASAVAASGSIGVTYTTTADPALDLQAVFTYLRMHGEDHGIDAGRLALWACSSHVPPRWGCCCRCPGRPAAPRSFTDTCWTWTAARG